METEYNGKISFEEIKKIARSLVSVIDRERIFFTVDLEKRRGDRIAINSKDFIEILRLSSNPPAYPYGLAYVRPGPSIPLEFKLNPFYGQTLIILKAQAQLTDYHSFARDSFDNLIQSRVLSPAGIDIARAEVERIGSL